MNDFQKTIIVIAGPTAVGKTAHAIAVAKHFNTSILSADSRQCYRELNIGVARPLAEELKIVPHYFIASHSIYDNFNAARYENYALHILDSLFAMQRFVVVTGGTGLYIKALTEGLDMIPEIAADVRKKIIENYSKYGIEYLQSELQKKDSLFSAEGEMKNPQRMMRALEVVEATGRSVLSFRNNEKQKRPFNIVQLGLKMSREMLNLRINLRVDKMMEEGLEAEARSLIEAKHVNALQTVGYKEMFDFFDGNITKEKAVELIKQNTRRYAKRQMTWFTRQQEFNWINVEEQTVIVPVIEKILQNKKLY